MKIPTEIEFYGDTSMILVKTLMAAAPEEGCGLLIGEKNPFSKGTEKNSWWRVRLIWPCCNIWEPEIFNLKEPASQHKKNTLKIQSRNNRFAIDPREQIIAQRWARKKHWHVLGTAHSHPNGTYEPSTIDCFWNITPSLMVIIDQNMRLGAWWVNDDQTIYQLKMRSQIQTFSLLSKLTNEVKDA